MTNGCVLCACSPTLHWQDVLLAVWIFWFLTVEGRIVKGMSNHKNTKNSKAAKSAGSVTSFFTSTGATGTGSVVDDAVIKVEALSCRFLVKHNISLVASDHAGQPFRAMFIQPGIFATDIVKKHGCVCTKKTAIIKKMANHES